MLKARHDNLFFMISKSVIKRALFYLLCISPGQRREESRMAVVKPDFHHGGKEYGGRPNP